MEISGISKITSVFLAVFGEERPDPPLSIVLSKVTTWGKMRSYMDQCKLLGPEQRRTDPACSLVTSVLPGVEGAQHCGDRPLWGCL